MNCKNPGWRMVLLGALAAMTSSCFVVPVPMISPLIEGRERVGPLRSSSKGLPAGFARSVPVRELLQASPELRSLTDQLAIEVTRGRTAADLAFVHLDVADGWLVGLDHGEWGGALWWISRDYATRTLLVVENVRGIVADRAAAIAICGLTHETIDRGQLERIVKDETWHLLDTMPLRAAPSSFLLGADGELELAFWHGEVATYRQGAIR